MRKPGRRRGNCINLKPSRPSAGNWSSIWPSRAAEAEKQIDHEIIDALAKWEDIREQYSQDEFEVKIRDKVSRTKLYSESLSGLKIPKIALPDFDSLAETLKWLRKEHLPGYFPYTAGVFQFRREGEDPKRQFAGEGPPERTNARFHYLTKDDDAKRLSTAFDSLTLYGEDPTEEPDIFGKIGESRGQHLHPGGYEKAL